MTLVEKLDNIAKTSTVKSLQKYPEVEKAKDFDELWKKVIEPNLPEKDVVIKWHNLLMKYIKQDNAVFILRKYGSGKQPRRGFLNKVFVCGKESFETFYTDNSVPFYFYSMAKDGFVPTLEEFNDAMITNRTFPYGYFSSSVGKKVAAYPSGKNPGINAKGYKLAHIFSAGESYDKKAGYTTISNFCEKIFPNEDITKWNNVFNGKHYRRIDIDDDKKAKEVRAFAVAHFVRSVHPLNFFLVPMTTGIKDKKTGIKKTNIYWYDNEGKERDEIGENPELIEYVAAKIKSMYEKEIGRSGKSVYQEFLDLIFPIGNCLDPKGANVEINAEYAIDIWKRNIGNNVTSSPTNTQNKADSKSTVAYSKKKAYNEFEQFEKFAKTNGVNDPSQYSSHIRKIMEELNIKTLSELRERVDWAIESCTQKMNDSVNEKEKRTYRNRRCSLKKYKEYLETEELYIHYKKGWSSFRPMGKYLSEYIIENNMITISHNVGFTPERTDTKKISSKDMEALLSILDDAIKMDAFETSNTLIQSVHDPIDTYDYSYRGESGNDCGRLFTDDSLTTRYQNLIDKITK